MGRCCGDSIFFCGTPTSASNYVCRNCDGQRIPLNRCRFSLHYCFVGEQGRYLCTQPRIQVKKYSFVYGWYHLVIFKSEKEAVRGAKIVNSKRPKCPYGLYAPEEVLPPGLWQDGIELDLRKSLHRLIPVGIAKDSPDYVEPRIAADASRASSDEMSSAGSGLPPPPSHPPPKFHLDANRLQSRGAATTAGNQQTMVNSLPGSPHIKHAPFPTGAESADAPRSGAHMPFSFRRNSVALLSMCGGSMPAAGDSGHNSLVVSPAPSPSSTMHTHLSAAARGHHGHRATTLSSQDLALLGSARGTGTPSPDRGSSTSSAMAAGRKRSFQQISSVRGGSTGSDRGVGGGSDSESGDHPGSNDAASNKRRRVASLSPPPSASGAHRPSPPRGAMQDFRHVISAAAAASGGRGRNLSDAQNAASVGTDSHYNGNLSTDSLMRHRLSTSESAHHIGHQLGADTGSGVGGGGVGTTPLNSFQTYLMVSSGTHPAMSSHSGGGGGGGGGTASAAASAAASRRAISLLALHQRQQQQQQLGRSGAAAASGSIDPHRSASPVRRSPEAAAAAGASAAAAAAAALAASSQHGSFSTVKTEFGAQKFGLQSQQQQMLAAFCRGQSSQNPPRSITPQQLQMLAAHTSASSLPIVAREQLAYPSMQFPDPTSSVPTSTSTSTTLPPNTSSAFAPDVDLF